MKENHDKFLKVLNDFKALKIDSTDGRMTQDSSKQFQKIKLSFEGVMQTIDAVFKILNDYKATRIDAECDGTPIILEVLFKDYEDLKLTYHEYQINNHESYQGVPGLFNKISQLTFKLQMFFGGKPKE
ncbi:hypothetical protein TSUD_42520 [Trifolium subterraneum]|uniref:Uncharacterized protein n=1 Tax=Trifolium subterraneum TaxID=3900 RepID=A0A2Z6LHJ4_TRISU|nr:hypothetical protein TSUD_42520 [Trifolium subterraneum]